MRVSDADVRALVDRPQHYQTDAGLEAIDVIEAAVGLDGHAANAIKYVLRHRAKGHPRIDLGKARWYVERLLVARVRLARRPTLGLDFEVKIFDAFRLTGPARDALGHLFDALAAASEDRYRAHLRSCAEALTRAADRIAEEDCQ